jgi:LemA protein
LIAIILIVIVVLVVLWAVSTFNGFVRLRNRVENAWAQIDVQLKRRNDLIPNLIETVKGYAAHEKGTLDAVIQARNASVSANSPAAAGAAEGQMAGALGRLFALSEAYPDLKANVNFLGLQEELSSTEGKIAYARQFYNDTVTKYNTKIETVPSSLLAGVAKASKRELFQVDEASKAVPKVQF